jgi:hypothetical protein
LDDTLARLKTLSTENQNAKSVLDEITPYYDFVLKSMKPVISIIVFIVRLIIILSIRYNADQEKWAFGSLGTIIGVGSSEAAYPTKWLTYSRRFGADLRV